MAPDDWTRRLHHDLVRPFLWRARDVRDDATADEAERRLALAAVTSELYDDEGRPIAPLHSWARFAAMAPPSKTPARLAAFSEVLARTVERLDDRSQPMDACFAAVDELDAAFTALAED
jgi:hypothetical protein